MFPRTSDFLAWCLLAPWLMLNAAWVSAAAPSWTAVADLKDAREFHSATTLPNGKVLVVGGYSSKGDLASVELYDPSSGAWSDASPLATGRNSHSATLLPNGKVLVVGGYGPLGNNLRGPLSSTELYDPATNRWTAAAPLGAARDLHAAQLLPNGKILVVGGYGASSVVLASAELYDPASDTWANAGSLATARHSFASALLSNGKVLVAGGGDAIRSLGSAELYDPGTNSWSDAGALATARRNHTATALINGKVLVFGGDTGNRWFVFPLASAELYSPESNTWTLATAAANARFFHTATTLLNGNVLFAGGYGTQGYGATAEWYNPQKNTWTAAGTLVAGRQLHSAALLQNGKVLIAGGFGTPSVLSSAELFDSGAGASTVCRGVGGAIYMLMD